MVPRNALLFSSLTLHSRTMFRCSPRTCGRCSHHAECPLKKKRASHKAETPSLGNPLSPTPHRRKPATTLDTRRRDASPLSIPRPLTAISGLASPADGIRPRPPAPIVPNGGCSGAQAFRSLSRSLCSWTPTGYPRFRVTPAGSLDSDRSKQAVSIFCVRFSVRS